MKGEEDDHFTSLEAFFDAMDDFPLPIKPPKRQQEAKYLEHDPSQLTADSSVVIEPVHTRRRRRPSSYHSPTSSASQVITSLSGGRGIADSADSGCSARRVNVGDVDSSSCFVGILLIVARLLMKALEFEIRILMSLIMLPFRLMRFLFVFMTEPFGVMRRLRNGVYDRIVLTVCWMRKTFGSPAIEWMCRRKPGMIRMAWGFFWSFYVGFVLAGCLLTAFLAGRMLMHYVVEEPIWIYRELSFDYTKESPMAVVPITPCYGARCRSVCEGVDEVAQMAKSMRWRRIPQNHKLWLNVLLTMPESEYNQNLGIFQVKAQFLNANGKVSASSSRSCMLRYKSFPIRYLETALKSGSILLGYSSESQIVKVKMEGLTEETDPTVCIRVFIEKRAGYKPGYGLPEIYDASIELASELPLLKKIIWNWRKTIFIWIATSFFIFELLGILVCCRPLIIPRVM